MINISSEQRSGCRNKTDRYHNVEFSIKGLDLPHQFRLWDIPPKPMCFLVKEGSSVLPLLKEGDTLDMKYYSSESVYPSEKIRTSIRRITKKRGRLKGHYLVGLEMLER